MPRMWTTIVKLSMCWSLVHDVMAWLGWRSKDAVQLSRHEEAETLRATEASNEGVSTRSTRSSLGCCANVTNRVRCRE